MRLAAILALVVALAGCGGHKPPSAEEVARAWSAALNASDNETAASLFAPSAKVVQSVHLVLKSHRDAVRWNASLPCGGHITRVLREEQDRILVVFRLVERPGHICDAPGTDAAAVFRVEHGKIVLWYQTDVPTEGPAV